MRPAPLVLLIAASLLAASPVVPAQEAAAQSQAATATPMALAPFTGTYQVFRDDKPLGRATMRLVNTSGNRWRIDLGILGTRGLAGLAGINSQQSTVFDVVGGQYRPITQATVRAGSSAALLPVPAFGRLAATTRCCWYQRLT